MDAEPDELRTPVADAHCDFLYYMANEGWDIARPVARQAVALPYMREGGAALQLFAAWTDPDSATPPDAQFDAMRAAYERMLAANPELERFTNDFEPACGRIGTVLTVEGGEAINGSIERLHALRALGVAAMTLTWNTTNELAHPAMSRLNLGLTRLGRTIVREMERIGMAIDVAHLSDAGIDDILRLTSAPLLSSHTNSREVCRNPRSLSDKHIKAIAGRDGVICVNFYPPQLKRRGNGEACISDIVAHIRHVADVGGIDHVGIGSDFDGMTTYPHDIKSWRDMPKLIEALSQVFSADEVHKIAYGNLASFMKRFV